MDGQYNYNQNPGRRGPKNTPAESMAGSALVLSVVAIVCVCCVYPGLVCGALAVILALLSRGKNKRPLPQGRLAIVIGIIAICLSVAVIIADFVYVISTYGSIDAFMESYIKTINELTDGAYGDLYQMYGQ